MRIERVEPIFVDRFLFVEITTDSGLVGLGESGAWGFHDATASAIATFAEYLLGTRRSVAHRHCASQSVERGIDGSLPAGRGTLPDIHGSGAAGHLWRDPSSANPAVGMLQKGAPMLDEMGYLLIGDAPGLGVSLRPDAAERFPRRPRNIKTGLHIDGSVVDQ